MQNAILFSNLRWNSGEVYNERGLNVCVWIRRHRYNECMQTVNIMVEQKKKSSNKNWNEVV